MGGGGGGGGGWGWGGGGGWGVKPPSPHPPCASTAASTPLQRCYVEFLLEIWY